MKQNNSIHEAFDILPAPIWEEDFSDVAARFRELREAGVSDIRSYLQQHPHEIRNLAGQVRIVHVNAVSLDFFDVRSRAELTGNLDRYFSADALPFFEEEMAVLFEGGTRFSAEIPIHTLTGEERFVSLHLAVVPGCEERLNRVMVTFIDITDRKRAEMKLRKTETHLWSVLRHLPLGVWFADADARLVYANPGARRIWEGARFVGPEGFHLYKAWWAETGEPIAPEEWPIYNAIRTREARLNDVIRIQCFDDSTKVIRNSVVPMADAGGAVMGAVILNEDITEAWNTQKELRRSRDKLEIRVAKRTAALQERAHQLARLTSELTLTQQRERQQLAERIHDNLQQILSSIGFRMDTLFRNAGDDLAPDIDRIRKLVDEAFRIARSITADLSPPILREAGLIAGLKWLTRWISDRYDLAADFAADTENLGETEEVRFLLFQSVRELLINAAKHAGVQKAAVALEQRDDGCIAITVRDEGKGFDPAILESDSERLSGGFGLFSIRERIDLMGGHMQIHSAPGEGARFTLVAPIRIPQPEEISLEEGDGLDLCDGDNENARDRKTGPYRILLADDHTPIREVISLLLSGETDMEIVGQTANGREAVEMARKITPDVILMDYAMPEMNGVEATRIIHEEMPDIRIIGLSMYQEEERGKEILEAGAVAYVSKTESAERIIAVIRGVLG